MEVIPHSDNSPCCLRFRVTHIFQTLGISYRSRDKESCAALEAGRRKWASLRRLRQKCPVQRGGGAARRGSSTQRLLLSPATQPPLARRLKTSSLCIILCFVLCSDYNTCVYLDILLCLPNSFLVRIAHTPRRNEVHKASMGHA